MTDPYAPVEVLFTRALVDSLKEWSQPVRVRIVEEESTYLMEFEKVEEREE